MKLFIFPHAGGFSNYYLPLVRELTNCMDSVETYEYFGRNLKSGMLNPQNFDELINQVINFVLKNTGDKESFSFFGHSMGAFVAYEATVKMKKQGLPQPQQVFISGQRPPCTVEEGYYSSDPQTALPYLESLEGLDNLKNIPEAVRGFFIKIILYDLSMLETYIPTLPTTGSLPASVVLLYGDLDPELKNRNMSLWSRHFKEIRNEYIFHGGHFYLEHHWEDIAKIIKKETKEITNDI